MFLLDEYDGDMMLLDIEHSCFLSISETTEDSEMWICANYQKNPYALEQFLKKIINIKTFFESADLRLAIRNFDQYDVFGITDKLVEKNRYDFLPDDSFFCGKYPSVLFNPQIRISYKHQCENKLIA